MYRGIEMLKKSESSGQTTQNIINIGLRILVLLTVVAFGSISALTLYGDGYWQLASMLTIITVFVVIVFIRPDAEPLRWLSPGLSLFLVFVLFPLVSTIVFAFTNYGTTNSLTKQQVIKQFEQRTYLPEGGITYEYTMFYNEADDSYALWLVAEDGTTRFVRENEDIEYASDDISEVNDKSIPLAIGGYVALSRGEAAQAFARFGDTTLFGLAPDSVQLSRSRFGIATELEQRYVYDSELNALIDRQLDINYVADESRGFFINTNDNEDRIAVGYQVFIGFRNFERFLTSPALRGPVVSILIWNFAFAILSVFFAFTVGLIAALAFNGTSVPERIIKTLLILPWAVPQVITILIWNGLLNPLDGIYANWIADIASFFGAQTGVGWPPIYSDATWSRIALLVLNTWFAYPYFMLISSGALQAIPKDLYEAAQIDGANIWQRFWSMTMPLLLLTVGPLIIGSFAVNFNSFQVIYLFNGGGPPMAGATTPAGHTDLLISYVYKLSFGGGGGQQQFGYAAAITIIIFLLLFGITAYNLRFMNIWEETGKNV
jgi:ABC-type sugar transport system permease subunit